MNKDEKHKKLCKKTQKSLKRIWRRMGRKKKKIAKTPDPMYDPTGSSEDK